jgi:hypothetical protein
MKKTKQLPWYMARDVLIIDLRDLGYESIELDDLVDMLEDDDAWIEYFFEPIILIDEISFLSPKVAEIMHSLSPRPT